MIIRTLRQDRGWSQEQLADVSGVSVRTIQRIETGASGSLETLKCLAAVFETTIPDLRKDPEMTNDIEPIASPEPARAQPTPPNPPESAGLTDEDRAALKYARNLRRYDSYYDDESGYGDGFEGDEMAQEERDVVRQVSRERKFYKRLAFKAAILTMLLVINLLTGPGYIWVVWPAIGMGISILFSAYSVFGNRPPLGGDWERRQVEKRLHQLAQSPKT